MQRDLFPKMLHEKAVQKQAIQLLLSDNWIVTRVNSGQFTKGNYFRSYIIANNGASKGFPDLMAFKGSRYLLLEMKSGRGGELRESQKEFIAIAKERGVEVSVVSDIEQLERIIKNGR